MTDNTMCSVTPDPKKNIETMAQEVEAGGVRFLLTVVLVPCREGKNLRIVSAQADINGKHYETPAVVVHLKKDKTWKKNYPLYATRQIGQMAGLIAPWAAGNA